MKEREEKKFFCKNCSTDFYSRSQVSKFCTVECRKEYSVKNGKNLGEDYVICQVCNRATGNATGVHLKNHPGWTAERYKKEFPTAQTIASKVLADITAGSVKAGQKMREDHHRERLSKLYSGEKNPMHKSRTTETKRKSSSPFSPEFYLSKNPDLSREEAMAMAKNKLSENAIVSWVKDEYWIKKGFTKEDAKKIISKKQSTFSLEKCIEKYGEEDGTKRWLERQEKWKEKVFNDTTHISRGYSEIGEDFVNSLLKILKNIGYPDDNILHGKNEKFIKTKEKKVFKYDLTFSKSRKIIEFNGDFWHCNPDLFQPDYYNKPKKMTAKQIWEYDLEKKKAAEENSYSVFYIWENEYRNDKFTAIKKCLDFLAT